MPALISMRQAYGDSLVAAGGDRSDVVVLTADVQTSDYSYLFGEAYPDRYFNVGIAEQCLIDVSVGLASTGFIPCANTFAAFMASRALEPILTHLAYGAANVKLMAGYSGLSPQYEGPTHHAITDVAVMRALPGLCVVSPSDPVAMQKLLPQVIEWDGPVYFRFSRNEAPVLFDAAYQPVIGKAVMLKDGSSATVIANGLMVSRALSAADELEADGISIRVLEMHTIKPLDVDAIVAACRETEVIVTVEEHSIIGGLGSAIAEVVADVDARVPVVRLGLQDVFAESGPHLDLLDKYGLSGSAIVAAARGALRRSIA